MKKLKVVKGAKCMACLECVRACSTSFYKEFDPDKSCIQIVDKNGDAKPMVCICGDGAVGRFHNVGLPGISGAVLSDFTGWGHFFVRCYIDRNPDQNGSISADRLFPDADSAKHCEGAHAFSSKGS